MSTFGKQKIRVQERAPTPTSEIIRESSVRDYKVNNHRFNYVAPPMCISSFKNAVQVSGSKEYHIAGVISKGLFYHRGFSKYAGKYQQQTSWWRNMGGTFDIEISHANRIDVDEAFTWFVPGLYWHWFLEDLPCIEAFRTKPDLPIYTPKLNHFQKESLEFFQDIKERIVEVDTPCYLVGNIHVVHYPSISNRGKSAKWCSEFLRDNLKPNSNKGPKRIYISRNDALARRVTNEKELIKSLKDIGFHIADDTTGMTLQEKINLFANADIVVAPTGANLTHTHSMKPGTTVIDFNHSFEVTEECGWNNIGDAVGLNWYTLIAATAGECKERPKPKNSHMTIDINKLIKVINDKLAI